MTEVADIFREHSTEYKKLNKLSPNMYKNINAIEACRTAKLGGPQMNAMNVVILGYPTIHAETDIVQNARALLEKNGLKKEQTIYSQFHTFMLSSHFLLT